MSYLSFFLEAKMTNREKKRKGGRNYILGKRPREGLLAAHFLRADKTVDRHGDGAVDILRGAVFREAHLAE